MTMRPQTSDYDYDSPYLACWNSEFVTTRVGSDTRCPKKDRDSLLVVFTNEPYNQQDKPLNGTTDTFCNENNVVRSVVEAGGDTSTPSTGSVVPFPANLYFKRKLSNKKFRAAEAILSCMSQVCCGGSVQLPDHDRKKREADEGDEETFYLYRVGDTKPMEFHARNSAEAEEMIQELTPY